MKIGIPSSQPDMHGTVSGKLGLAEHLLLVETDDMSFESMDGPPQSSGPGAGVMAMSLVVNMGAQVILVGHIAPHIAAVLTKQGIEVITGISGSVDEAVKTYIASQAPDTGLQEHEGPVAPSVTTTTFAAWSEALRKGSRQFYALLPRLVGVILLLGLFRGCVSEQMLLSMFPGFSLYDSIWGAALGSVLAGNAVNSYIIGKELVDAGVGLAAATALMLAWVNVGVIQLPAESAAMGRRFALVRNVAGFIMAVGMSYGVLLWQGVGG